MEVALLFDEMIRTFFIAILLGACGVSEEPGLEQSRSRQTFEVESCPRVHAEFCHRSVEGRSLLCSMNRLEVEQSCRTVERMVAAEEKDNGLLRQNIVWPSNQGEIISSSLVHSLALGYLQPKLKLFEKSFQVDPLILGRWLRHVVQLLRINFTGESELYYQEAFQGTAAFWDDRSLLGGSESIGIRGETGLRSAHPGKEFIGDCEGRISRFWKNYGDTVLQDVGVLCGTTVSIARGGNSRRVVTVSTSPAVLRPNWYQNPKDKDPFQVQKDLFEKNTPAYFDSFVRFFNVGNSPIRVSCGHSSGLAFDHIDPQHPDFDPERDVQSSPNDRATHAVVFPVLDFDNPDWWMHSVDVTLSVGPTPLRGNHGGKRKHFFLDINVVDEQAEASSLFEGSGLASGTWRVELEDLFEHYYRASDTIVSTDYYKENFLPNTPAFLAFPPMPRTPLF